MPSNRNRAAAPAAAKRRTGRAKQAKTTKTGNSTALDAALRAFARMPRSKSRVLH